MKDFPALLIISLVSMFIGFGIGNGYGHSEAQKALPSCLYINRPLQNDIKPWGCDGKEGVDVPCSLISGGGIYVSLDEWKNCK